MELSNEVMDYLDKVVGHISPALIDRACDTSMKRAFMSAGEIRTKERKIAYKEVEDLLRARETILENIKEWEDELKQLELGIKTKTSASCIVSMSQKRISQQEYLEASQIILQAKIERDKLKMEQLDRGLDKVKKDKYYKAFKMKYYDGMSNQEIADKINDDVLNVGIKIFELLKRITWKLYGTEVL